MDRHSPRRPQRDLFECPVHNPLNLTGFLVQSVADVLPFLCRDHDALASLILYDQLRLHLLNRRDLPVVVACLAGRVVAHEHHLSAFPQTQPSLGWIGVFREYSFDLSLESGLVGPQCVHLSLVDRVGLSVVGCETNPTLVIRWHETRIQPFVQFLQGRLTRNPRPNLIQNVKEYPVALTMNLLQLDRHVWQPPQHLGIEEERR